MVVDQALIFHRSEPVDATFARSLLDAVRDLPEIYVANRSEVLETIAEEERWRVSVDIRPRNSEVISDSLGTSLANYAGPVDSETRAYTFGFWIARSKKLQLLLDRLAHLGPLFDKLDCEYGHGAMAGANLDPPVWIGPETWEVVPSVASLFGPSLVDRIGRDRLFELQVLAVREYEKGSIVVVAPARYGTAAVSLSESPQPYVTGRLPDPPLSFDDTAPSDFDALSSLEGWGPGPSRRIHPRYRSEHNIEPILTYVKEQLSDDVPRTRASAIRTLARAYYLSWDDLDRLPESNSPFTDEAPVVRAELIRSTLPAPEGSTALEAVRDALAADDHRVRYAAAGRLADVSQRTIARELTVRARDDPSPRVRAKALTALVTMDDSYVPPAEAATVLQKSFERDQSDRVRTTIMSAAGTVGATSLLLDGLEHENVDVRAAAASALSDTDGTLEPYLDRLRSLLAHQDAGVSVAVAEKLVNKIDRCGDGAIPSFLCKTMSEDPSASIRAGAAWVLGQASKLDPPLVRAGLSDPSERVRATVIEALVNEPEVAVRFVGGLLDRLVVATDRRELEAVGSALQSTWAEHSDVAPTGPAQLRELFGSKQHSRGRAAATMASSLPEGQDTLRDVVETGTHAPTIGAALSGLGACDSVTAIEHFESRLEDADPYVRSGAIRGASHVIAADPDQDVPEILQTAISRALETHEEPILVRAGVDAATRLEMRKELWWALCDEFPSREAQLRLFAEIPDELLYRSLDPGRHCLSNITDRAVFDTIAKKHQHYLRYGRAAAVSW